MTLVGFASKNFYIFWRKSSLFFFIYSVDFCHVRNSTTDFCTLMQKSITIFRLKFFCLTVPKHFVEETFCAVFQKISGSEKVYG